MVLRKTLVQTGIFGAFKLLSQLVSFAAFVVFARLVGPQEFGVYTFVMSVVTLLQPVSDLGMLYEAGRRSVSSTLRFLEHFFSTFLSLDLAVSLLVAALVRLRGYPLSMALLAGLVFLSANVFRFFTQTHMVWGRVRFISLVMLLDRLVFAGLVLLLPKRTESLLLAVLASFTLSALYLWRNVEFHPHPGFTWEYFSLPFFLSSLFQVAAERLPMLVYDWRFGLADLGNFGAAFLIFQGLRKLVFEAGLFITMRGGSFDPKHFRKLKKALLLLAGLGIATIYALQPLVAWAGAALFGGSYASAGTLLSIMLMGLAPAVLDFYSQTHLFYSSPRRFLTMWVVYVAASVSFSLMAPDIGAAAVLMVLALFIKATAGWLLVDGVTA